VGGSDEGKGAWMSSKGWEGDLQIGLSNYSAAWSVIRGSLSWCLHLLPDISRNVLASQDPHLRWEAQSEVIPSKHLNSALRAGPSRPRGGER
jgi:hypothetical protein